MKSVTSDPCNEQVYNFAQPYRSVAIHDVYMPNQTIAATADRISQKTMSLSDF